MFQFLASILTMSLMLLHSLLGCCTHHAHACEHGHVVEDCVAGHEQHKGHRAEIPEAGHEFEKAHGDHCEHHHGEKRDGHEHDHDGLTAAHEDGHDDHESHECPHDSCGFDCEGEDCTYTPSSKVKTPTSGDSGLSFPLAITHEFVSPVTGLILVDRSDTGPPKACSACCCRTMTQVWRL
jgi:hypothetical protein